MKRRDIYGGRDPREIPNYTVRDVARYVRLPYSTVRSWCFGQQRSKPVIIPASDHLLSFTNLVELFVLASVRRHHRVPMKQVRTAVHYLRRRFKDKHPLAHWEMFTDGAALFVEELGRLVNASTDGQLEMRKLIEASLKRVERDAKGVPFRLHPIAPGAAEDGPRLVAIDPRIQFGRPCLAGTSIPIEILSERFFAGDRIAEIAADYDVSTEEIERAIQFSAAA